MSITVEVTISENLISELPESGDDDVPEPSLLQQWASAAYLSENTAVASVL
ncbi:MAG: hypothetical protein IMF17_06890, partial [Proteobacteria bacterium]|nr:hypothetical protein [Pseudomonadota bacterium]